MNHILKNYYGIELSINPNQYFLYKNNIYYLSCLKDMNLFFEIYHYYCFLMHQCHLSGYTIVKNNQDNYISQDCLLLYYHEEDFDFSSYLQSFLFPMPYRKIKIMQIKEQWICKIDKVKELVKQYAYSFKHNPDLVSLIYYYTGLAENCINILNEILKMNKEANVSMSLALKYPIEDYVYELLNPCHYVISTRMRHLVYLIKSHMITPLYLKTIFETFYFDIYEVYYFYARLFFPSTFFDDVLSHQMTSEEIEKYFQTIEQEQKLYQEIIPVLSFYVSLPEISWLNRKNMI